MRIEFVQNVGKGVGRIRFKANNDGTIYINAEDVTLDEILEAIEMVKSGKLVIDL